MTINILGVGRSGTTALYSLLQELMRAQLGNDIHFFYEPFLWDKDKLNGPYEEQKGKFKYIDSLSSEGIYNHEFLPLLITNIKEYSKNSFLEKMYHSNDTNNLLIKYIRANGRYRLINDICPEARSIFILRNPLDVANSIKNRFSFYGGEFHRDDQDRFIEEVNSLYKTNYSLLSFRNNIDEQLFYWYYMNKFALESFSNANHKPLILCYEDFVDKRVQQVERICHFTDLLFNDGIVMDSEKPVGSLTKIKKMSKDDYHIALEYLEKYFSLLDEYKIEYSCTKESILRSYDVTDDLPSLKDPFYGLHSRAISKKVAKQVQREVSDKIKTSRHIKFAHIVNPVIVPNGSDLYRAQPITFETMKTAKEFADIKGIEVEQYGACFQEDQPLIPNHMRQTQLLDRSILDYGEFSKQKKLPMLQDILQRVYEESDAEYIIYTNVDIALMPHFYLTAEKIMNEGYDVVNIFRRTLDDHYHGIDEIPDMYADLGGDHPGTDCFIIKRDLIPKLDLQNVVIGAQFVAFSLRVNLHLFANKIKEFNRLHMTFHIGDDRVWEGLDDFSTYNANEVDNMFESLKNRDDIVNPDELLRFYNNFQKRKENWKNRK